jgi:DNA-binding response OmpR family regulator
MARVLVADTDRNLQAIFRKLFAEYSYDVEISDTGIECLQKLRESPPELLVIDLHIPWGGGDGVLAAMRDDFHLRKVPVVLAAREDSVARLVGLASSSVVKMVVKPFSRTSILDVVRLATARRGRILHPDFTRTRRDGWTETAADGTRKGHASGRRVII